MLGEEIPDHGTEAGQTAKDLQGWWGKNMPEEGVESGGVWSRGLSPRG